MSSEILEKIQKLSPTLKAKLSDDLFLDKLDQLESQYGIKVVLILLKLLLKELPYAELEKYLMSEYNFNQVLAIKIKNEFGRLIIELSGKDSGVQNIKTDNKVEIKKEEKEFQKQEVKTEESKSLNQNYLQTPKIDQPIVQNNFQPKELENKNNQPDNQPKAPSLTFFKEDEEEIKQYQVLKTENGSNFSLVAREISEKFVFNDRNEDLIKRLENIVLSKLKGVRDEMEVKDVLMKDRKLGGLEFTNTKVDELLSIIKKYLAEGKLDFSNQKIEKQPSDNKTVKYPQDNSQKPTFEEEDGLPVIRMPKNMVAADDYLPMNIDEEKDIKKSENKILPIEPKNVKINKDKEEKSFFNKIFPKKTEDKKVDNNNKEINVKLDKESSSVEGVNVEVMPAPKPMPYITSQKTAETVINNKNPNKPSLDDVKFQKQTFGPVEELENMTLIEFRRISADPKIAVNKIKEKIDLLEKQSFQKRIQGISAWQRSEVNKFYRLLGQTSMNEGKPVEEIIRTRLFSGKPTLSLDEFEVILELNKQLRF